MCSDITSESGSNFILDEIAADIEAGRYSRDICTRFPPEPNGFMHLGHAKAALTSYGLAKAYNGIFNLRFDDTNPTKEEQVFVNAMKGDLEWLLECSLDGRVFYASDYFPKMYACAIQLIEKGLAYVEELSLEEIRDYRGDFHTPGRPSPWRERPIEESVNLFKEMREGKFEPGSYVLRAKIDPTASNMNMRDPLIYRIFKASHYRAGDWHIYPLYDFAHPLSDAFEGITHSLCGKEFENHRPLYDWFLEKLDFIEPPRQIEFAEISVNRMILSKRHLKQLVTDGAVTEWGDPRMPTISGLRRLGYPAVAIREFCEGLGVSVASDSKVERTLFDHYVRKNLENTARRVMGVPDPIKVVIENYPEDTVEQLEAQNMPRDESFGSRLLPFSREVYIDRSDFMEVPAPKYHRLSPGKEVRLRFAYVIKCTDVIKDPESGEIIELRATYDIDTKSGQKAVGRKVKGTIQWVNVQTAVPVELRLYDQLFTEAVSEFKGDTPISDYVNPDSLCVLNHSVIEASVIDFPPGTLMQLERVGYFCVDQDSTKEKLVLNRTVSLRETKLKKILS